MGARKAVGITAKVTSKGQITIPKEVRDALGLVEGMSVDWTIVEGKAIMRPRNVRAADLAGMLHRPGVKPLSIEGMDEAIAEAVIERDERSRDRH